MEEELEKLKAENEKLRYLLWLHHGCEHSCLYGDDGEMQCNRKFIHGFFGADFKRDSASLLEWKLGSDDYKKLFPMPLK